MLGFKLKLRVDSENKELQIFVSVYAIKTYRWNGGIDPLIPNLGSRRK
jgi:hypothetical protein